ncbi:NAD(P)/FAD-dependent oxidoreductase [Adhaeribacter pallidiroseus]|uniref:Sarcosine oxidase n=1 Tax=Adhaeribacter pallidiroseus TaxID=2072847 RepID=A0A369QGL6_9BACT|nr:FAD-binding oxidoreductase [Adhaeribacter pallidiroseus]RDC63552.1 Sarcosine oxidase [Adhaeribacter pallidiroseus]
MTSKHPHIIIIGAGIVGASLTYHLAKQNARVTLLDKAAKPANEATEKSFAWIVAGYDATQMYMSLRQQAISDWHRVEDELNRRLKIDWTGALTWLESNEKTEEWMCKLKHSDSKVRLVEEQELRLLEPNLKTVPSLAMFAEDEGAINPNLTTNLFIKAAQEWGAKVLLDAEVLSLLINKSAIEGVATNKGTIIADVVVLATGVNTVSLCHPLHLKLPIDVSPAILMELHNPDRFVNHIVSNPFMEIRAASDTLTLAAENYIDESSIQQR